jgi:hypothetical protein
VVLPSAVGAIEWVYRSFWKKVSHLHADHVGGIRAMRARTFSFSAEPLEPRGIPAYVPAPMRHRRADVAVTTGPRVIAPGMAVLPPLPRMLFWAGYITEQALVVNVRGSSARTAPGWRLSKIRGAEPGARV